MFFFVFSDFSEFWFFIFSRFYFFSGFQKFSGFYFLLDFQQFLKSIFFLRFLDSEFFGVYFLNLFFTLYINFLDSNFWQCCIQHKGEKPKWFENGFCWIVCNPNWGCRYWCWQESGSLGLQEHQCWRGAMRMLLTNSKAVMMCKKSLKDIESLPKSWNSGTSD